MTSEAARAARRELRREGLNRLMEIAPAEEVLDGPPCLSCGHADPHPAVDGCSFASCGCTAQTWVPCPTRVCAPELTKRNCLSCPGIVQTCSTCNGDGIVMKITPGPMTLDPTLDEQGRHVLRGTAANGEPVTIRVPCEAGCTLCAAHEAADELDVLTEALREMREGRCTVTPYGWFVTCGNPLPCADKAQRGPSEMAGEPT